MVSVLTGAFLLAHGQELSLKSLALRSRFSEISLWSLCCQMGLCSVDKLAVANPGS